MSSEEFEIIATDSSGKTKRWTRSTYDGSKGLADNIVDNHDYESATVRNIFGGHPSDILYEKKKGEEGKCFIKF